MNMMINSLGWLIYFGCQSIVEYFVKSLNDVDEDENEIDYYDGRVVDILWLPKWIGLTSHQRSWEEKGGTKSFMWQKDWERSDKKFIGTIPPQPSTYLNVQWIKKKLRAPMFSSCSQWNWYECGNKWHTPLHSLYRLYLHISCIPFCQNLAP